ncbi:DNA-binding protein [Xanthomonas citri pv. fuscans]|uniref:Single-stranded DNA-binding protein n=1 Tax=Xanthomonas citri pv. fuscans TaxID=366649 RepID=A0AB34Q1V2_XANCI|nr:single-stranded DNA-binding protein [Xanthomonas citri]ATS69023.1 DNA-binding protein [Xanthomonas citri pv. phaseoli var. fuscans]ATS69038.1 DNA-binding protein [Xanthomonas citri pv. phaseoli var. fuscans]ATS78016.1 DNA-binding protein [Xanthomonas citri pv. phaseoli var. fuscans]ATS80411.1 DNA-binding protein [Xanthomonas citri pv. phaseoli var. fuscans]ATS90110.1 DNA-binding protein [Xanthomonas citri pv. phaseoli var. fuscans]
MKVQVMSSAVAVRSFPAREGKPATHFREQTAAVLREGDFPLPFTIGLDEDQAPYGEGFYVIDPKSLQNNKFGGLEFGRRIRLVPDLTAKASAPATRVA